MKQSGLSVVQVLDRRSRTEYLRRDVKQQRIESLGMSMKHELQAELIRRYSRFFRQPGMRLLNPGIVNGGHQRFVDSAGPFDERGIECGDGWYAMVDQLCRACELEIETLISRGVAEELWPRVAQIKQKLGGLRFYVSGQLSDGLRAEILRTELEDSVRICECCGKPAMLRENQWLRTLCDVCDRNSGSSNAAQC